MQHSVGETVDFLGMKATIRYLGDYHLKPGVWIGLELDKPKGKNNGTIRGKEYFQCEPNCGLFISYDDFVKHLGKRRAVPSQSMDVLPAMEEKRRIMGHSASATTVRLEESESMEVSDDLTAKLEAAKRKLASIEHELRSEAKIMKELQTKTQIIKKEHDKKLAEVQKSHEENLLKMEQEYLEKEVELQDKLLEMARRRRLIEYRNKTKRLGETIHLLEQINEENEGLEWDMESLRRKHALDINNMKRKKTDLEKKLEENLELWTKQKEEAKTYSELVDKCKTELQDQSPVLQETKSLRLRISRDEKDLEQKERKLRMKESDAIVNSKFMEEIASYFRPAMKTVGIVYRIRAKAQAAEGCAEKEDLLHFLECCLFALGKSQIDDESFLSMLAQVEQCLDAHVWDFDLTMLTNKLKTLTPMSLHLAITPHLLQASAYRIKSNTTSHDVTELAKCFDKLIHPSILFRFKEDFEKLSTNLRIELRRAEHGETGRFRQYERLLREIVASEPLTVPRPIIEDTVEVLQEDNKQLEDPEIPVLRRRVIDTEFLIKQYKRYSDIIESTS